MSQINFEKDNSYFDVFKIKNYKYWTLYLHENQCYIGRTYLLSKRIEPFDFMDISSDEREELFTIAKTVKSTLEILFKPDLINYAVLCNVFHRLHMHIVPRYRSKRTFHGYEFIDKRWGLNYSPYDKQFILDDSCLMSIKTSMIDHL